MIKCTLEILNVTVPNRLNGSILILVRRANAREVWSEPVAALWISAHAVRSENRSTTDHETELDHLPDDTQSPSVEIPRSAENNRLAWTDIFGRCLVRPFPRHLYGGLYGLGTGVHRKNPVIAKDLFHLPCKAWKDGIVECTRGQCEFLSLLYKSSNYLWVTMTLENVLSA